MKLMEIEKLTNTHYVIDVPLNYLNNYLINFGNRYDGFDFDPDFHRAYVWTDEQKLKYIEFIIRGGTTSPIMLNCPSFSHGDIPNGVKDLPDVVTVVDGKQRLTTLLDFLDDKIKVFGRFLSQYEDKEVFLRRYSAKIGVNNIHNKKELLKWYLEMNEGLTAHTSDELNKVRNMLKE